MSVETRTFLRRNAMPFFFSSGQQHPALQKDLMRIFIFIGWFRGSVKRTDEYPLDLQIGISRIVLRKEQGLRQDFGGEGKWQARADRNTATASRGICCVRKWAREGWLEIRRREQVSAQRGSYRWERASSVGVKNSELKPSTLNKVPSFGCLLYGGFLHII